MVGQKSFQCPPICIEVGLLWCQRRGRPPPNQVGWWITADLWELGYNDDTTSHTNELARESLLTKTRSWCSRYTSIIIKSWRAVLSGEESAIKLMKVLNGETDETWYNDITVTVAEDQCWMWLSLAGSGWTIIDTITIMNNGTANRHKWKWDYRIFRFFRLLSAPLIELYKYMGRNVV